MSQPDHGDRPDPQLDHAPDPAPGGPADRVVDDEGPQDDTGEGTGNDTGEGTGPVTPDPPRSAQVGDDAVPDEIEEPEHMDEDEQTAEPGDEPSG